MLDDFLNATNQLPTPSNLGDGVELDSALVILVNIIILLGLAISFIAVVISFVKFILSMGDPKAAQEAQRSLTWSVIALVLCLIVFGLKSILANLLGASFTSGTVSL